jgi:hypothetical protein
MSKETGVEIDKYVAPPEPVVMKVTQETQQEKDTKERIAMQKRIEANKKDKIYVKVVAMNKHEKGKTIDVSCDGVNYQIQDGAEGWIPRMVVENLRCAVHTKHKFIGDPPKHVKYDEPHYLVVEAKIPESLTDINKAKEELLA